MLMNLLWLPSTDVLWNSTHLSLSAFSQLHAHRSHTEDLKDLSPLSSRDYRYGCEPKASKDDHFKKGNNENEH